MTAVVGILNKQAVASTETEFLTRDEFSRKVGLMAIINAHMSVNVKKGCFFRWLAIPMINKQIIQLSGLLLAGQQPDLAPKTPDFRDPVKPDYFTDLTPLALFKLFGIFDAAQGHKSQR